MIGRTISHYQILEKLGEGGMGAVYKAKDTHLDRFVAIKVLPPEKVADSDRRRRFTQEAKAASALNHPNIVTIHDIDEADGVHFISMEFVAGKTLGDLIPRHGMRLGEVLKCAIQIADALAKAHAAAIIHRDLKPGNIMVTEQGLVKVLDFGLAKLTETAPAGENEATRTMKPATEEGNIVGTVAYMSPEQAEGKMIDARSDIFSFGSVLYEMLTGHRAFQGDTKASTIAAILKEEPKSVTSMTPELPRDVEKVISRCLRKDRERRFQHMDDLKVAFQELKEESDSGKVLGVVEASLPRGRRVRRLIWTGSLIVLIAIAAAGAWLRFVGPASNPEPAPRTVPLTSYPGNECCPSFSPDGNQVAFVWNGPKQDNEDIYVKLIGTENALRLTSDPAADQSPAWSPDGRYIAFVRFVSDSKAAVFLVPAIGGPERKVAEVSCCPEGLSWFPDGKWLAVADKECLYAISVDTGEKRKLTFPPSGRSDSTPAFSPNGGRLIFSRSLAMQVSEIYLLALSHDLTPKGEPKQLTFRRQFSSWPAWFANGREIVFSTGALLGESELWRMPASGAGSPQALFTSTRGANPAISRQGNRLAYTQLLSDENIWRLEVPGSAQKTTSPVNLISSTYQDTAPQYSPDGKRIVFVSARSGHPEIWVCGSDGSNALQLTSLGVTGSPRWSPDGQRIIFDSTAQGQFELYMIDASGGSPRRMTSHPAEDAVASWSRDGHWIYFASNRTKEWQVWKMPAEGGDAVQVTKHGGYVAFESLDGKSVYFSKEVFLTSIWRIPVGGGEETKVLDSVLGYAFAVGDKGIYFVAPHPDGSSTVRLHSFAAGKDITIAEIHKPLWWGLSVSLDERYILYTQTDQAGSDLMLVEHFR